MLVKAAAPVGTRRGELGAGETANKVQSSSRTTKHDEGKDESARTPEPPQPPPASLRTHHDGRFLPPFEIPRITGKPRTPEFGMWTRSRVMTSVTVYLPSESKTFGEQSSHHSSHQGEYTAEARAASFSVRAWAMSPDMVVVTVAVFTLVLFVAGILVLSSNWHSKARRKTRQALILGDIELADFNKFQRDRRQRSMLESELIDGSNTQPNRGRWPDESFFAYWTRRCGGTTTLAEEVLLARKLYDHTEEADLRKVVEEEKKEEEEGPVHEILEELANYELKGKESLMSWKGISVDWFFSEFCETRYAKTLKEFGCEMWFVRKVCIVEMLRREKTTSGPLIQQVADRHRQHTATIFISYTGSYTFAHFMEMLSTLEGKGEYMWLDIFCVDQFAWISDKYRRALVLAAEDNGCPMSHRLSNGQTPVMMDPYLEEAVKDLTNGLSVQIKKIQKTALMLEKWNNVMATLGQIWVVWEIFSTVEAGAMLIILLGDEQVQRFTRSLETSNDDYKNLILALSQINAGKATAQDENDRNHIMNLIEERGGVYNVNFQVTKQMHCWLAETGYEHLSKLNHKTPEQLPAIENLAWLLHTQGKLAEAEILYKEALQAWTQAHYSADHPIVLNCLSQLAGLLHDQGRLQEATPLLEEALSTLRQKTGQQHPATLACIINLATLLHDLGKLEQAKALLQEALVIGRQHLGLHHPTTLIAASNLALLHHDQGRQEYAEKLLSHVLSIQKERLGDNHPDTLASMGCLGVVMHSSQDS